MATARIIGTYHPDASPASIECVVTYDAIDSPDSLKECVTQAMVLWSIASDDEATS